jgi:hypothetical protein
MHSGTRSHKKEERIKENKRYWMGKKNKIYRNYERVKKSGKIKKEKEKGNKEKQRKERRKHEEHTWNIK